MNESPDFSKALEQLQYMLSSDDGQNRLQGLLEMFSAPTDSSTPEQQEGQSSLPLQNLMDAQNGMDFDTIIKIANVMQAINSDRDNPKTAFLSSLRPFLKESRRKSLDRAATVLKVTSALKAFKGGEQGGV